MSLKGVLLNIFFNVNYYITYISLRYHIKEKAIFYFVGGNSVPKFFQLTFFSKAFGLFT